MTQQRSSESRSRAANSGRGTSQFIEKGWTVYDALERPIGNVTDVDVERNALHVDGRATGFGAFEVPLSLVEGASSNEVRLSKVVDEDALAAGAAPRFIDPPSEARSVGTTRTTSGATTTAATGATTRTRVRTSSPRTETTSVHTQSPATGATTEPLGEEEFRTFTPPYAEPEPGGKAPTWRQDEVSEGWSAKSVGMAGLALGGLAATAYMMRRRMRRKTRMERLMGTATTALGATSAFASERHPAWWASLAAALPIVYYAWPSSKPTPAERRRVRAEDLAGSLSSLAAMLPFMPDVSPSMTERMRQRLHDRGPSMMAGRIASARRSNWNWSPKPDLAGTVGALAAGGMGLYLLRRMMSKPASSRRISEVMTRQPRVIQPDATVADAATIMRRLDVGALPVCDGSRLIGMLTDRDITTRATAEGRDPFLTPVRDVMSPGVAWASEDDPVEEAARIMREHRIRRLPIVNERHTLVGVVSLGDLAVDVKDDDLSGETLERVSEPSRADRMEF